MADGTAGGTQAFQSSKTTLCDTVMLDVCHYPPAQTHSMYDPKRDPNVNHGLWGAGGDVSLYVQHW